MTRPAKAIWPARMARGALIGLVRLYQAALSPLLGKQCRYQPTCSQYFIEAVQKRGALVGGLKGLWRILRCHPFAKGGYDPVDPPAESQPGERCPRGNGD